MFNALTTREALDLKRDEQIVAKGLKSFVEVGLALRDIRDRRLYRGHFSTFEEYCAVRWELTRPRAYQLCNAAKAVIDVSTNCIQTPENEAQARPLTVLKGAKQRAAAWQLALKSARRQKRKVTAQDTLEAVRHVTGNGNGKPKWPLLPPPVCVRDDRRLSATIKPYYDDGQTLALYRGDCRKLLPKLPAPDVVITDPVWPNAYTAYAALDGAEDPVNLFKEGMAALPRLPKRLVVILRLDSDPRFLAAVPAALPFFRVQILNYMLPRYIGRKLGGFEIAYSFGEPIPSRRNQRVIPGFSPAARPGKRLRNGHPCPRALAHMEWLLRWWTEADDLILDPFCGSATTLLAARNLGRACIGVEINESFCRIGMNRLRHTGP